MKKEETQLLNEVIRRVRAKNPNKKPRTLKLNDENYMIFERLCKEDGYWPSEVLDEFIALYIEHRGYKNTAG